MTRFGCYGSTIKHATRFRDDGTKIADKDKAGDTEVKPQRPGYAYSSVSVDGSSSPGTTTPSARLRRDDAARRRPAPGRAIQEPHRPCDLAGDIRDLYGTVTHARRARRLRGLVRGSDAPKHSSRTLQPWHSPARRPRSPFVGRRELSAGFAVACSCTLVETERCFATFMRLARGAGTEVSESREKLTA